jgi:hypothetical protein
MNGIMSLGMSVAMGLLLAACGSKQALAPAVAPTPAASQVASTVMESMTATLIPRSNRIWELAGGLYDDAGNIDPKLLADAQWDELKDAAIAVNAAARALAGMETIKAAPDGAKLLNEGMPGAVGAAQVQAAIDADPAGFREQALQLQALSDELVEAAGAHDGVTTDGISARLVDVCGDCHQKFWQPN